MKINGYICNCGSEEFDFVKIDGPNHYSDYEVGAYDLLKCTKCNSLHIRIVHCDSYDMTGDHDEYSTKIIPISLSELSSLLVSFDRPDEYFSNKPIFRGRQFIGSMKWAQEYGDAQLIELVRLKTRVK